MEDVSCAVTPEEFTIDASFKPEFIIHNFIVIKRLE